MKLLNAVIDQNLDTVKRLLTLDPSIIDAADENGLPMALVAARTGNLAIVRYIVEYSRASMNIYDEEHKNILHYASISGNVNLARYLVEKVGMSPVEGDSNRLTPFEIARDYQHLELLEYYTEVCGASLDEMFKNPIRTGMFPDPSIIRVGEDYYMVNSSFVFFPCIPISHSKDLVNWRVIGHAITNPEWAYLDDLEGGRGYWAPDISYSSGIYTITATYRLNDTGTVYRKQMVVTSEKVEGPYSEPVFIDEDGIDPSIFNDDDGRKYMLLNRGARIFELSPDGKEQISEASLLFYGDHKRAPEGPHLLKKDGYYYLFLAEGGTGPGHRITVSRAKSLHGNYEPCPYNPIMRQWNETAPIQRAGHGKPVMTQNGDWYMVYLCGRNIGEGYSLLGRETALDPITWTGDGWPIVNDLKGPSCLQKKPDLPWTPVDHKYVDEFDETTLDSNWMFPRPPEKDGYHIKDSKLILKGSRASMSLKEARNILLRRQEAFCFQAETTMDIVNMTVGQDYGLTAYYDENTWLKCGVFATDQGLEIGLLEHIGHEDRSHPNRLQIPANTKRVKIKMETRYLRRSFYVAFDDQAFVEIGTLDNVYYLSDEGINMGKRFTGAMMGVYVYGGESELRVPFERFEVRYDF